MSVDVTVSGSGAVGVTISGGRGPQGPAGSGGTGGGAVSSVQGRTGTVTLTATDLTAAATSHTHSTTDIALFAVAAAAAAPVQSVAGRTGAVVLVADDITAGTINRDLLPVATTKALGAVQASSGLSVDDNGHLSANVRSVAGRTGDVTLAAADISGLAAAAPVQSVQGRTGTVVLSAADITAAAASHTHAASAVQSGVFAVERLPVATATAVGVVSASSGLAVTASGALSANVRSVAGRTGDVTLSGGDVSGVVTSLNSLSGAVAIAAGSNITVAAGGTTVSISSTGDGSPGGVTSVAAVTGSVTITAFGFATSTSGQAITFDARPVRTSPAAFTSNQNDYNPGAGDIFRLVNGTTNTLDITGFATTSMSLEALVINVSTHTSSLIRFRHQNTNSTAVNRIISPWGGDVVLASGGTAGHGAAVLVYDTTDSRWRVTG